MTSPIKIKLGKDAKLFIGTAGVKPATQVQYARDISVNLERDKIDITSNASGGWNQSAPGLITASIEFEMILEETNTASATILSNFISGASFSAAAMDGPAEAPIDGVAGDGPYGDWWVSKCARNTKTKEATVFSVTLEPYSNNGWGTLAEGYPTP